MSPVEWHRQVGIFNVTYTELINTKVFISMCTCSASLEFQCYVFGKDSPFHQLILVWLFLPVRQLCQLYKKWPQEQHSDQSLVTHLWIQKSNLMCFSVSVL